MVALVKLDYNVMCWADGVWQPYS